MNDSYYHIFGDPDDATDDEIKAAYKRLAKQKTGHFYVNVIADLPGLLNKKQKELFEAFARSCRMAW